MTIAGAPQALLDSAPLSLVIVDARLIVHGTGRDLRTFGDGTLTYPIRYSTRSLSLSRTRVFSRAINKIDRHDENYAFSLQLAVRHSCDVMTHPLSFQS
ncbi:MULTISPECIES: hypothetical protein [unclassified Burkholderia]|uniref:hypothetical protein n=1 Tax=unclassified Burkholderia TaxID=2613784 RepID=UPI000F563810|nr:MULTISPECIES: hypothetical protein [unclassified Burkholderia]